jgi:Pyruvate/2-oxoacid:ferredoxin oxidoreductase delta subunit
MVTSRKETQMHYQPTSGDSLPPITMVAYDYEECRGCGTRYDNCCDSWPRCPACALPRGYVRLATVPAARADEEKARLEAGMREQDYCIALKSGDQCALYCPERKRR